MTYCYYKGISVQNGCEYEQESLRRKSESYGSLLALSERLCLREYVACEITGR